MKNEKADAAGVDEALATFDALLAIWADALDGKPWPAGHAAPRVKALFERTQRAAGVAPIDGGQPK
jgi:hypothetical protein